MDTTMLAIAIVITIVVMVALLIRSVTGEKQPRRANEYAEDQTEQSSTEANSGTCLQNT